MNLIYRFLCLLLLVSAGLSQPVGDSQVATSRSAHNLILCDDATNAKLIYSYELTREALLFQTRVETLVWPYSVDQNLVPITCIRVLDQIENNNGGYVELTSGGIGFTYVQLVFTSQWSRRMSFKVEIYVRKS